MSEGNRSDTPLSMEELLNEARMKMPVREDDLGDGPLRRTPRFKARRILKGYGLEQTLTDEDEPWIWAQALSESFPLDQKGCFLKRPRGFVFFGLGRIPKQSDKYCISTPCRLGGMTVEAYWILVEGPSGIMAIPLPDHRLPMPWVSIIISRPSRRANRVWISNGQMHGLLAGAGHTVEWHRRSCFKWERRAQPVSLWFS